MAANLGQLAQVQILDSLLHTGSSGAWTAPASIWVGLCSSAPTDTATNEVAVALNYGRKEISFGIASTASPAACTGPTLTCTYTSASGTGWGVISGYILCKASTGSTGASGYIAYGSVSPNVTVTTNDIVEFAAAAISLSLD